MALGEVFGHVPMAVVCEAMPMSTHFYQTPELSSLGIFLSALHVSLVVGVGG